MPTETDNASETEAYRQFPANFMVFTSGEKTPQDLRSGSVYKCFAHVSTTPAPAETVRPRLLGVASDTMPWNALQKTRRVGVTVRGAVTVAVNKDELAACQIGDLLEYKVRLGYGLCCVGMYTYFDCSMIRPPCSGWGSLADSELLEFRVTLPQNQSLIRA